MNKNDKNIVLIGMPGCGKTTVGKKIASKLHRPFLDTDVEIFNFSGKTPSEIIQEKGEPYFRQIETEVCRKISTKKAVIIATGGGAILRSENVSNLKKNGILFFINRDIQNIKTTKDRPLSNTQNKLLEIYKERLPIYKANSDFEIISDENIEHTINSIVNKFLGETTEWKFIHQLQKEQ